MTQPYLSFLQSEIEALKTNGLYKAEHALTSAQQMDITVEGERHAINFCANNYLGLANEPRLIEAAKNAMDQAGFGMASVRFICGTQALHKQLEARLSRFLGHDDTILYSSCFDANAGLFETLLGSEDAIISDALNHASIIDGVRLCKAQRFRYQNNDMKDLEEQLKAAKNARFRLIATDGVFSMDGIIANLPAICELADKYDAMVMVDDSHATGFMGATGAGTPEHHGVTDRIDIVTGTLGKALGGASGGYTSARKEIVEWLRNRSRPYLFSNALAPMITAATLEVLNLLEEKGAALRNQLNDNATFFRSALTEAGFTLVPGEHAIIPVMIGDAALAGKMASALLGQGIYVIGFSYPVVPHGKARIRTQMSAAHTRPQLEKAAEAFTQTGKKLGII
ncbi:MAG: glycine C-acetyltransferase [Legionellales bacterium]|nr:glycine C-acetyltransferase [Legionellales bacterium]